LSEVAGLERIDAVGVHATGYRNAIIVAFVLCALLTLGGLLAPPTLSHDAAWGMREWQTYRSGGPIDNVTAPDPTNIARDRTNLITWWSPGQYLVPGALTLLGLRLGTALTVTSGLSLLGCLLGWIYLARYFGLRPRTTTLLVLFIATFRYSTLPFGIYNGGEILLQGLIPWLMLAACRIPLMSAVRAGALAFVAVLLAFFTKLTGVMVVSIALLTGGVEVLIRLRRITIGMVAGAVGAALAFGSLYIIWFSHGSTPASGTGFAFRVADVLFAFGVPWMAGTSWTDMLTSLSLNSRGPFWLGGSACGSLSLVLWLLVPGMVLFSTVLLKGWQQRSENDNLTRLSTISACFYMMYAFSMSAIFLRGGDVSLEERHLRAPGMLILFCVFAAAERLPLKSAGRLGVGALCILMSLYGCGAFLYHAKSMKRAEIDGYSGTYQPFVDESALEFMRGAFVRDARDTVFVLPSPEAASALPPGARVIANHIEFEPEETIAARRYQGKARGRLYVVVPAHLVDKAKVSLLLKEFQDYPPDGWQRQSFDSSTMFTQEGTRASD
jgi:hypothetical protein